MNDPEIQAAQVAAVKVIRKQAGDLLGRARIAMSDPPVGSSRRPEADPGPAVDLSWEDFLVRTRATEVMAWCRAKAKKATCLPVRWRDEHAGDWEWGLCPPRPRPQIAGDLRGQRLPYIEHDYRPADLLCSLPTRSAESGQIAALKHLCAGL